MGDQDQPLGQPTELPRYSQTVRFRRVQAATHAYNQLQRVLYEAEENDLSAYNLQLNGIPFVVVLGEPPAAELHECLRVILRRGEPASLPEEVLGLLLQRRAEESRKGPWVEHHYRPGRRLP